MEKVKYIVGIVYIFGHQQKNACNITISNVFYCCLTLSRIGSRPKQFNLLQLFGKHWQNMISESDNSIFIVVLMFYTSWSESKNQLCHFCYLGKSCTAKWYWSLFRNKRFWYNLCIMHEMNNVRTTSWVFLRIRYYILKLTLALIL